MKCSNSLLAVAVAIASASFTVSARASTVPYAQSSSHLTGGITVARAQPDAGATVPRLRDLVGARAGQAENAIRQRGYRFVKTDPPSGGTVYSYWLESRTNYCVTIRTEQGRYRSIVYTGGSADCNISSNTTGESPSSRQPTAGTTVPRLSDLVGARAGQAENAIRQRGYRFVKADEGGYTYWLEGRTNYCVTIRTDEGRYQSIVYTGGAADCNISSNTTGGSPSSRQPTAGTTVPRLSDLVGARAGQAENAIRQRGYRFVKADEGGYTYWLEGRTNYCVTIRTDEGRYQSIVYTGGAADCQR